MPEKSTALPAVSIVPRRRLNRREPRTGEGAAEAIDDEQRIVDPEGQGDIRAKFPAQIEIGRSWVPR